MADTILCPQCGTPNPLSQKNCQRCQTPLNAEAAFAPGDSPVHIDTGELEPLLPEWLRDARESSKHDETSPEKQVPRLEEKKPTPPPAPAANMDFLAGLQSQSEDDDEGDVPDWLASITGTGTPKSKADEPALAQGINWTDSDGQGFAQPESVPAEEVPDWLAGLQSSSGTGENDELTDWLRNSDEQQQAPAAFDDSPFAVPAPSPESNSPDWLPQMATEPQPKPADTGSFGTSNWFDQPSGVSDAAASQSFEPSSGSDSPDWLKQIPSDAEASAAQPQSSGAFDFSGGDTPDWLSSMGASESPAAQSQPSNAFTTDDTPDWLSGLGGTEAPTAQPQPSGAFTTNDTPDWLNSMGGGSAPFAESAPAESEPLVSDVETPSWLTPDVSKTLGATPAWLDGQEGSGGGSIFTEPMGETPARDDLFGDMPDWLKSAAPDSSIFDEPARGARPSNSPAETPQPKSSSPFEAAPAFEEDIFSSGGDGLFTEMPDWLSNAMDAPASPVVPEAITGADALAANVLPSWVEAMRPVEQSQQSQQSIGMAAALSSGGALESQGGLAGLSGVLPAGAGFTPTSKPKPHSIKLIASEDQLRQAGILEQVLAAENSPVALTSEQALGPSRGLRWGLAFVLLAAVFATALMGLQVFSTPVGVPAELKVAVSVAQAIPADAPVLVAFDYDPSRAGEMEAAAAPLFDHMMILSHPRLTFVATNEYGTMLAERFISGPLAARGYQSGVTYLNLGYLPGGQMGIRAFAQSPLNTKPFDINSQPAWSQTPLLGVSSFDQFAAIILVTDNADVARSWIEQTQDLRGAIPFLVVASAQASPMIQPYYEAGQVQGMVSGLYGGTIVERQYNNGSPGLARTYWDGYSIGMLLAAVFVLGGGLMNLAIGMRDRSAAREGK